MYTFSITTYWNNEPSYDTCLHGSIELTTTEKGLNIGAKLPHQRHPRVPNAPSKTRVSNLWEYDVVECFLVGSEKYLEVELGAGGHFLVLDFNAPRIRNNEYTDFLPKMEYVQNDSHGSWKSTITIPWSMVPKDIRALNAFVIVGENYLSYAAFSGEKLDFHQIEQFPKISLDLKQELDGYSCKNPPA